MDFLHVYCDVFEAVHLSSPLHGALSTLLYAAIHFHISIGLLIHKYTQAYTQTNTHTQTNTRAHAHAHAHTHKQTRTHTHTNTNTHTH